jgi:gas vesicle protein
MLGVLFGAVIGAVAATYWHPELRRLRDEHLTGLRNRAADNVEVIERAIVDTVGKVSERARTVLRRDPTVPRRDSTTSGS